MPSLAADNIASHAALLAKERDPVDAADKLIAFAGGDRPGIEAARDLVAAHLHEHVDDWDATATLTLLNRALSRIPRNDPLDWRVRWSRHRKP
jgi:hypothetical protein